MSNLQKRDIKLDIVIDIALDNLLTTAEKFITDENGRPYELSKLDILLHTKKECDKLIKKMQTVARSYEL